MTLFASVLTLDKTAIKDLRITDPYSLHRTIYDLHPDIRTEEEKRDGVPSGILYADQGGNADGRNILLLANRLPANVVAGRSGMIRSKEIPESFLEHECYRFKLVVNPTRRGNADRKLIALRERAEIMDWLMTRTERNHGFRISPEGSSIEKIETLRFKDKRGEQITMTQAHAQGLLNVTERTAFRQSFRLGIGRGRAFGCGLLQIAPVIQASSL
jgi:CRISPR system Cascade subunit CasE